jgi:hypothetical protein
MVPAMAMGEGREVVHHTGVKEPDRFTWQDRRRAWNIDRWDGSLRYSHRPEAAD